MSLEKFWILMWKNCIIQRRRYILGILEAISPVLIVIIITLIIGSNQSNSRPSYDDEWQPSYNHTASIADFTVISYSPNSPWIEEFLTNTFNITNATFQSFDSAQALKEFLYSELLTNILGMEFDDSLKGSKNPPNLLSYTLRFSSAIESTIQSTCETAVPEIEMISIRTLEDDKLSFLLQYLPAAFIITNLFTAAKTITNVAVERESRLKETMRIMGLSNAVYWTAWLTSSLLIPIGSYTLVTVFLCFMFYSLFDTEFKSSNYVVKLLHCLPVNTGLCHGISIILQSEANGPGLQMINFASHDNVLEFSIADVLFSFVIASIIHMLLTVYIDQVFTGNIGIPKPWYFPIAFVLQHCKRNPLVSEDNIDVKDNEKLDSKDYEADPQHSPVGIRIAHLTKKFGSVTVVNQFSLNMFQDQITVLLGHNGCGKTTTLSMLTGLLAPTSGTAILNNHDIRTETSKARSSVGWCPQHDILIEELTVRENLIFFCRLKGIHSKKSTSDEIAKFADMLDFTDRLNSLSKNLSGGQKRKLSISIALSGGSKVVMLDEPTAGLDAGARRMLWNFLIEEKKGRTILLTTHYMDEADILGDRIAIMNHGELQTVGSPFFLKKRFGSGYKIICVKDRGCHATDILNILRKFVPDAYLESDDRTEIVFALSEKHVLEYPKMFKEIEKLSASLKIASFGLSVTSLEEVFLKVGSDKSESHLHKVFNDFIPTRKVSGFTLVLYQIYAMILKQFHYTRRNFYPIGLWLLITVAFVVAFFAAGNKLVKDGGHPDDRLHPDIKVIVSHDGSYPRLFENCVKLFGEQGVVDQVDSIENHLFHEQETADRNVLRLRLSLETGKITAWFSNDSNHEIFILHTIHRALLKSVAGNQYDIKNVPFSRPDTIRPNPKKDYSNEMLLMFGMLYLFSCYWPTVFIAIKVKECATRTKLLQFISGGNRFVYWLTSLVIDCLFLCVVMYLIIGTFALKQRSYFKPTEELVIFMFNGFSAITFIYMTTFLFAKPVVAMLVILSISAIFCTIVYLIYLTFYSFIDSTKMVARAVYWIFLNLAPFSLLDCIIKRSYPMMLTHKWTTEEDAHNSYELFHFGETGIGANVIVMIVSGALFLSICLLLDHLVFQKLINLIKSNRKTCVTNTTVDNDVEDEIQKVKRMSYSEFIKSSLVLDGLSKWYGRYLAVNQLYLSVNKAECFGLLGVNGAGKTSTFKMLTGDEGISMGDILIHGKSVKSNITAAQKSVGYCPQSDALMLDISGRENLKIFSLIRGIPWNEINDIIENISKEFGFYVHLDKKVQNYSGGNKRKISAALSLLGDPSLILLDEPTTGIDPYSKRQLWSAIINARDSGKSVILTSHSMEECEALCTRIAIMAAGEFKCMGSVQHLKNKFCKGFNLTIKLKRDDESELQQINSRIVNLFPSAQLMEKYLDLITFRILTERLDWGVAFGTMTQLKSEKIIDDFTLNQMSLEEVFLHFANNENGNNV
ncbi:phospholipid-transporting ATPase ABCA1-like [Bradysia coprophila]|uniref:phospholipid-transporting ATPase ABCA1-like n=1 Tax=Bradysia coprophila TaxID=38358 RepID=UPI00187DB0B3|nr:phospholipid-transporting ATPase ABCA1-like [Bradysia coprophila]